MLGDFRVLRGISVFNESNNLNDFEYTKGLKLPKPPNPLALRHRGQTGSHRIAFLGIGHAGQCGAKEKEAQDNENDKQLDENYQPQRASPRHSAESVAIETPNG